MPNASTCPIATTSPRSSGTWRLTLLLLLLVWQRVVLQHVVLLLRVPLLLRAVLLLQVVVVVAGRCLAGIAEQEDDLVPSTAA